MAEMTTSSASNSIANILRESIHLLLNRNEKLMVQFSLLLFAPFSMSVLLHQLIVSPIIMKVQYQYETSSFLDMKDVLVLVGAETPFFLIFCSFLLILLYGIIYISAASYNLIPATLQELMLSMKSSLKRVVITWMITASISISYIAILVPVIWLSESYAGYACSLVFGALGFLLYLYFALFMIVGIIACILTEDGDIFGLQALREAGRLMKGRKLQGFLLMLLIVLLSIPIFIMSYITLTDDDIDDELGLIAQILTGLMASLSCLAEIFTVVVFTVFYFNCKQSNGDRLQEVFLVKSSLALADFDPTIP